MKIETKYNIGDEVWTCDMDKQIYIGEIEKIRNYVLKDGFYIDYLVRIKHDWNCWIAERNLYPTKEELIKSL